MALSNFYLTDQGNALMARAVAGTTITITKAEIGEGTWQDGTTYANITALAAPLKVLPIVQKRTDTNGQTIITVQFSTDGIGRVFRWSEFALWAADPDDPKDSTKDFILGTSRATTQEEAVPFDGNLNEFNFNIILKTSSAANVEIIVDESIVYPTFEQVEEMIGDAEGENLLRNWYLPNAVNRKGLTTYGHAPEVTVDCWVITGDYAYVDVTEEYLTIRGNSINGYGGIMQMFPPGVAKALAGKTATMSILAKTYTDFAISNTVFPADSSQFKIYEATRQLTENSYFLLNAAVPVAPDAKIADIIAVKLELGEKQTLARQNETGEWELLSVPDYAEEYAKCIQYSLVNGDYVGMTAGTFGAVSKTGDQMTGDLDIRKNIPHLLMGPADTTRTDLFKNAAGENDYGTFLRDISGDQVITAILTAKQGKFYLHKDGVEYPIYSAMRKPTPAELSANQNYGFLGSVNLLDWALTKTVGGTFFTDTSVTGVPEAGFWHGILTTGIADGDRGILIFNGTKAYAINTSASSFAEQEWNELITAHGNSTIHGSLSVNYGSGTFTSWLNDEHASASINSYFNNSNGRIEVITSDVGVAGILSHFNGADWNSYQLYHTGNAPVAIATAELVE